MMFGPLVPELGHTIIGNFSTRKYHRPPRQLFGRFSKNFWSLKLFDKNCYGTFWFMDFFLQKIESLEVSKSNTQYLLSTFYALYVHFTTQSIYIPCLIKCKILSPNSILPELVEEEDCQQSKLGPGKPPTRRLLDPFEWYRWWQTYWEYETNFLWTKIVKMRFWPCCKVSTSLDSSPWWQNISLLLGCF